MSFSFVLDFLFFPFKMVDHFFKSLQDVHYTFFVVCYPHQWPKKPPVFPNNNNNVFFLLLYSFVGVG